MMAAARSIGIDLTGQENPRVRFAPENQQALPGDLISWANNDPEQSHWPAPINNGTIDKTGFMSQAIPPDASSLQSFSPSAPGVVSYCCAIDGHGNEKGSITVLSGPPALTERVAPTAAVAALAAGNRGRAKRKPTPQPKPKPKSKRKPKPKSGSKPKPKPKPGSKRKPRPTRRATSLAVIAFALLTVVPRAAHAQSPASDPDFIRCADFGAQKLIKIPEINRDEQKNILRAVIVTADEKRNLWPADGSGGSGCVPQYLRFFKGWAPGHEDDWKRAVGGFNVSNFPEPIPGPTLRARVGDLIEITFLNQIQPKHFGASFDLGEQGVNPCDATTGAPYPGSDDMPNCIHGSSTANLHFHGTHTTPGTTGDNVLVQIRPSLRTYPPEPDGKLIVTEDFIRKPFAEFFTKCEASGSPATWNDMTSGFRTLQMGSSTTKPGGLIGDYDRLPQYKRAALWLPNQQAIQKGTWPTFFIGAFPYCFRVPEYDPSKVKMGQAPGTHWYHAHKHGSTHLNVSSGMTGALIIEGDYDKTLREFYKNSDDHKNWDLEEQVLMIQQLSTVPDLLSSSGSGAGVLSVNGRQRPILTMRPGQVQLWRFINGASRNMVTLCPVTGLTWRQTAQDGVQFSPQNYDNVGKPNARIDLTTASRADLLVQAPTTAQDFTLMIVDGVATPAPNACGSPTATLLTVHVDGTLPAAQPPMPLIAKDSFPAFPKFLEDIPASDIRYRRELMFATMGNGPSPAPKAAPPTNSHYIDGHQFTDQRIDQSMLLDTVEEWKVMNGGYQPAIHHPFHIHVNPFQVTEVFDPNAPSAMPGGDCAVDPAKPETWHTCNAPTQDFVWRDVMAIPSARKPTALPSSVCTVKEKCPEPLRNFVTCTAAGVCNVTIPGYFKMRSRFADYPGEFVLHCHILIHEDRGMMQLVEVVPNKTIHTHR